MSTNIGIDYGLGRSNIDQATGVRYGVLSQHSVGQAWYDQAEADYGPPHCPKCGKEAGRPEEFGETFANRVPDDYTEARFEEAEYVCVDCKYFFGSESAYGDEPVGYHYDSDGYILRDCLVSDIFVIKSPYYTHAQFCSPCVPGAGNLDSPCAEGPRAYCLHHDWFEGGHAPYPVFSVESGKEIKAIAKDVPCPNCQGTGRDNIKRVAQVRGVVEAVIAAEINEGNLRVADYSSADGSFQCWRCEGRGALPEIVYEEHEHAA